MRGTIRTMGARSVAVVLATVALATACSTFGEDETKDPRLDAAAPDGSTADADAGAPADGGDERGFCASLDASSLLFCKDFEDGLSVNNGFAQTGGAPLLDTTTSTSPTHAMWAQTGGTYLRYDTLAASLTRQHVHVAAYLGNFATPTKDPRSVVVLRIVQGPGPTECVHELYARQDGADLEAKSRSDGGVVSFRHQLGKHLETRRWTAIDIVLDQDIGAVNATVKLDGETVLASRKTTCLELAADVQVFVGLVSSSSGEARFDDFVFGHY